MTRRALSACPSPQAVQHYIETGDVESGHDDPARHDPYTTDDEHGLGGGDRVSQARTPTFSRSLHAAAHEHLGRGLHSFTSQFNLSAVHGIGAARRGYEGRCKGVSGGV